MEESRLEEEEWRKRKVFLPAGDANQTSIFLVVVKYEDQVQVQVKVL